MYRSYYINQNTAVTDLYVCDTWKVTMWRVIHKDWNTAWVKNVDSISYVYISKLN